MSFQPNLLITSKLSGRADGELFLIYQPVTWRGHMMTCLDCRIEELSGPGLYNKTKRGKKSKVLTPHMYNKEQQLIQLYLFYLFIYFNLVDWKELSGPDSDPNKEINYCSDLWCRGWRGIFVWRKYSTSCLCRRHECGLEVLVLVCSRNGARPVEAHPRVERTQ